MGSGKGRARRTRSSFPVGVDTDIASRGVNVPDGYAQLLPTIVMIGDGVATKMDMAPPPKEYLVSVFVNEKEDPPFLCLGHVRDYKREEKLSCEMELDMVYPLSGDDAHDLGSPLAPSKVIGLLNEVNLATSSQDFCGLSFADGGPSRFSAEELKSALSPALLRRLFGEPVKIDDEDLRQLSF